MPIGHGGMSANRTSTVARPLLTQHSCAPVVFRWADSTADLIFARILQEPTIMRTGLCGSRFVLLIAKTSTTTW
jgi:hypothetical protein